MKIYELVKTQVIDSSIDNVFDFFAKPEIYEFNEKYIQKTYRKQRGGRL